ncbi:MAG: PadR family transcriptional regulator [Candidatus Gastranaerophilales bacterium]|nr:PadR family transcriptional regulator [Candidatus Gastranaerophilales bacterium]
MTEILILYILNKYDCTIYKLIKLIDELFFAFAKTSSGSVNPALKKLEELSCVEFNSKMSEGGMKSKTYSITPLGKKHLRDLILCCNLSNPAHILNETKILLYCSNILSVNELIEFKENLLNVLQLYEINLERGLQDEYNERNELQKNIIKITLNETKELIKLL